MSTPSLPSYTHADSPLYSRHPRGDEQTLGLANRAQRPGEVPVQRRWARKTGNLTLTLLDVPEDVVPPVYGRNTAIEGFLTFASTDGIACVQVKLEGQVKCKTIAEIGSSSSQILSTVVTLWRQGTSPCPTVLPFRTPFSATFTLAGETEPLPPSFEYTFYDVQGGTPGLRATVKYSLHVHVEMVNPSLKDRFSSSLSTGLIYLPRSRPMQQTSSVPATVFEAVMDYRGTGKSREVDPIVWKLILPHPGIYSLKQPIPFRVAVTSRSSSLIAPFAPRKKDKALIRVYVLRQVSINVHENNLWRSFIVAEGTLTYMPQSLDQGLWLKNVPASPKMTSSSESVGSISEREGWASYDWTGVLNIDQEQVKVGGFKVGAMRVKDFIVLSVVPPNPDLGSLLEVKRVVPIQLTTDNWGSTGQTPSSTPFNDRANMSPESNGFLEGRGQGLHIVGHTNGTHKNGVSNGTM